MSEFRHEYKYMVDALTESLVKARITGALKRDAHASENGSYIVRSLYFDDIDNSCLYGNLDGIDERSKFRIRYYNDDTKTLRLEKKIKTHGMTGKKSCLLSLDEFRKLYEGQGIRVKGDEEKSDLVAEFFLRGMRPKVIVTYERLPFVHPAGNVRVTFDRKLTSSTDTAGFIGGEYRQRPVFALGNSILEVKFDEFLPVHIKKALQTNGLQWSTFSKYYMCRVHEI